MIATTHQDLFPDTSLEKDLTHRCCETIRRTGISDRDVGTIKLGDDISMSANGELDIQSSMMCSVTAYRLYFSTSGTLLQDIFAAMSSTKL
jgi:hypothetical protein